MPRSRSDTTPTTFRLSAADLAILDRIVRLRMLAWIEDGLRETPNRTQAVREAIQVYERQLSEQTEEQDQ